MSPSVEVNKALERLAKAAEKGQARNSDIKHLDARTRSLVMIGAAICTDAPAKTFASMVKLALAAGATSEEVVGTLLAVAPEAGGPRVVTAAPKIALALGYDVDAAFEHE